MHARADTDTHLQAVCALARLSLCSRFCFCSFLLKSALYGTPGHYQSKFCIVTIFTDKDHYKSLKRMDKLRVMTKLQQMMAVKDAIKTQDG